MSSKAQLLLEIDDREDSEGYDKGLLESLKSSLTGSFERTDWINYAAKLKKMGMRNADIVDKIPYKISWLKKYVNPVFEGVTLEKEYLTKSSSAVTEVEKELVKPFNPNRTIISFKVTEINKSTRFFKGWGTVEMKDLEGEIVGVEGLERVMPIFMKRGAPVTYGHSNKHVGRLKNYKIMDKSVKNEKLPAVEVSGQIFSDYQIDDLAWKDILLAMENDDPVLSLAGTPVGRPSIQCDETECFPRHDNVEVYEWAVLQYEKGQRAANPEAKVFEAIETEDKKKSIHGLQETIPVLPAGHQLVDMMMSKSVSCQDRFKELTAGKTENEARETIYREMIALTKEKEKETKPDTTDDPCTCPDDVQKSTDVKLANVLKSIDESLAGVNETQKEILSYLKKEEEEEEKVPPPPSEEEEKEKEKADEKPADPAPAPAMNLSKDNPLAQLAKQQGYHLVPGPAPAATNRQITADLQEDLQKKKDFPTSEEMREAIRTSNVTALARKHGYER